MEAGASRLGGIDLPPFAEGDSVDVARVIPRPSERLLSYHEDVDRSEDAEKDLVDSLGHLDAIHRRPADDKEVEVAVRAHLLPGRRAEEDDP